jgi:GNAT superfamily N-acetyltransferase
VTPTVEITRIKAEEVAALWEVVQRYWQQLMPHAPVVTDPDMGRRYFAARFQFDRSGRHYWWATVDGTKVGFAFVELDESLEGLGAQIGDFYIERAYQRQGYGTAFIHALIEWLKAEGVYRIDLNVRQDNPGALAFWKSVGFEIALYVVRQYLD